MDDMTRKRAISELEQIYGMLSPDKQRALDMAINSLKVDEQYDLMYEQAEPTGDLISRQAVLDAFGLSEKTRKYGGDHSGYDTMMLYEIQDTIESLPSAEKAGHWIDDVRNEYFVCNKCHTEFERFSEGGCELIDEYNYCPNCGCRMFEPQESEVSE